MGTQMQVKYITKRLFLITDTNEQGLSTGGAFSEAGTILFGCDDRLTPDAVEVLGLPPVCAVFCNDYRRSTHGGVLNFEAAEKFIHANFIHLFTQPELWWENPENRWHIYKFRPDDDILSRSVSRVNKLGDNEQITIGSVDIDALLTPGDTESSMSFIVHDEGVKVGFCGGLLHEGGKIPYLYRLVQGKPGQRDYHLNLGGIPRWKESLAMISNCDLLVPNLGGVIANPKRDIEIFSNNIDLYYENYAAISALNFFAEGYLKGSERMDRSPTKDFPAYIEHICDQAIMIRSKTGNAIIVDCGSTKVTDRLLERIERKDINAIDAMFITHYHDDHVDGCAYFREHFNCPIYTDESIADLIQHPIKYRLPCISQVSVDATPLNNGHTWQWEEFVLTSFPFPGQTLYHCGLVVKNGDDVVLFAGDSFTATGIDDYCPFNRNLTGENRGFRQCLKITAKYAPNYIIGQHWAQAFTFSDRQLEYMDNKLREREELILRLTPWAYCGYAIDPGFVMAYPYEQDDRDQAQIRVTEHGAAVSYEIVPPPRSAGKNIYGIRVYIDGAYVGQLGSFIVNLVDG